MSAELLAWDGDATALYATKGLAEQRLMQAQGPLISFLGDVFKQRKLSSGMRIPNKVRGNRPLNFLETRDLLLMKLSLRQLPLF